MGCEVNPSSGKSNLNYHRNPYQVIVFSIIDFLLLPPVSILERHPFNVCWTIYVIWHYSLYSHVTDICSMRIATTIKTTFVKSVLPTKYEPSTCSFIVFVRCDYMTTNGAPLSSHRGISEHATIIRECWAKWRYGSVDEIGDNEQWSGRIIPTRMLPNEKNKLSCGWWVAGEREAFILAVSTI